MAATLGSMLLRKGVGAMVGGRESCGSCHRTPLPGEVLYVLESGRIACALCRSRLPPSRRDGARAKRVHADERPLAVSPRAA